MLPRKIAYLSDASSICIRRWASHFAGQGYKIHVFKLMKASIIIATKDRSQELERCLQSLSLLERLPDEVIVVDASSSPWQKKEGYPFPLHVLMTEPGLTRQRNRGFQASQGEIVVYLDDDVVLEPDYLSELLTAFQADEREEIGAATGLITNLSRPGWRHPFRSLRWLFNLCFQLPDLGSGRFRLSGFPTFSYLHQEKREVETLSGCNMAFRRAVLNRFRFDENLEGYAYMEDDDIAYRVSRHYRCVYVPQARLVHLCTSNERSRLREHKQMLARNHRYLFRKNLPQTPAHRLAFWVSIFGQMIIALVLEQNLTGVKGILEGLGDARRIEWSSDAVEKSLPLSWE